MGEVWKKIVDGYEVSTLGRVRSKRSILKQYPHGGRKGFHYLAVCICGRYFYVHLLVLETFRGPRPPGNQARHYPNQDRTDNRLENLNWGTAKENEADKVVHGTTNRGERHGMSRFTHGFVERALDLRACGNTYRSIGMWLGMSTQHAHKLCIGQRWSHISR